MFLEGNKTYTENGLINFKKSRILASTLSTLHKYQMHSYTFPVDGDLERFLSKGIVCLKEAELYAQSKRIEPASLQ